MILSIGSEIILKITVCLLTCKSHSLMIVYVACGYLKDNDPCSLIYLNA